MLPQRNPNYLAFIRKQRCLVYRLSSSHECEGPVDAHHCFKFLLGVSEGGLGKKGSDYLAIPLCRLAHSKRHGLGRAYLDDLTVLRECVRLLILYFT